MHRVCLICEVCVRVVGVLQCLYYVCACVCMCGVGISQQHVGVLSIVCCTRTTSVFASPSSNLSNGILVSHPFTIGNWTQLVQVAFICR
jgi:hypothetical protein